MTGGDSRGGSVVGGERMNNPYQDVSMMGVPNDSVVQGVNGQTSGGGANNSVQYHHSTAVKKKFTDMSRDGGVATVSEKSPLRTTEKKKRGAGAQLLLNSTEVSSAEQHTT